MATLTTTDNAITIPSHHAHLWIGAENHLIAKTEQFLQQHLCPQGGCAACSTCAQIQQHQHHALLWLAPEKQYTLDIIDQIYATMAYALTPGSSFFFVLQRADTLSSACNNRLLKSLEEPTHGYTFILLAHRTDAILPTLRSRCIMHTWYDQADTHAHQQLIDYFTKKKVVPATEFMTFIDSAPINEYQTTLILDTLLTHWIRAYQKARLKNDLAAMAHMQQIIAHLYHHVEKPPMPGSTKLFWKNLFLQLYG
jgi:hypothetical protein